jgi:hypothetical protein
MMSSEFSRKNKRGTAKCMQCHNMKMVTNSPAKKHGGWDVERAIFEPKETRYV